jgi:MFS superfamily sulfate permease-like transporter
LLPNVTLAAVVIVYSVPLIQPKEFLAIRRVRTMEFGWAIAACLGVLFFGTLQGIVVAIVVSLIGLSSQAAHPPVHIIGRKRGADVLRPLSPEHPDDETLEGLLIVRPEGRLFFGNAQYVGEQVNRLNQEHNPKVLTLDLSRVTDLEYSTLQVLTEADRRLTGRGLTLWIAGLSPSVLELVRKSGLAEQLGDRMIFNSRAAIARYQSLYPSAAEGD